MANGIRTGDPRGFNKGCSSKFHEGSWVRQTPEEARRTYWPKHCGNNNNNKDEDNSPKNLNDENQQASSQQLKLWVIIWHEYKSLTHKCDAAVCCDSLSHSICPSPSRNPHIITELSPCLSFSLIQGIAVLSLTLCHT